MTTKHVVQSIEGTPEQLGAAIASKVVFEVGMAIAVEAGAEGVAAFYTALVTSVMCQVRIAMGEDTTKLISEAALRNVLMITVQEEVVH